MALNPETGKFEPVTDLTSSDWVQFKDGEIVEIKGIKLRVKKIKPKEITFKIVRERNNA